MFAIIAEDDLEMLSLDVKTAFLYAPVPTGQTILMRRPTVAEFIAAHVATKEIMWARSLLGEL
eukprot:gene61834-biopygen29389